MPIPSPLPVRNGVNATRLRVPGQGRWESVCAYVLERFGHMDPKEILQRFDRGEVVAADGTAISRTTRLGEHDFIWYYRNPPAEQTIPFHVKILFADERIVVADKPPFLPTTPGGRFLQETALVRLRQELDEPELTPLHRLDRLTQGIVIFARRAQDRGAYQQLFERRRVFKTYEALAPIPQEQLAARFSQGSVHVRDRLEKSRSHLRTLQVPGEVNAHSEISYLGPVASASFPQGQGMREKQVGLYRLIPHTGKTHQLRVHMASLGVGIRHDPFYPRLLDEAPDDYSKPLGLLARDIRFEDPFSGEERIFESSLRLG